MPGSAAETLQVAAIVVANLYFARDMLVPVALAVLLSFVLAPLVRALRRVHAPRVAAVLLVVTLGCGLILGVGTVMGRQASVLAANLPTYKATIAEKLNGLQGAGGLVERLTGLMHEFGTAGRRPKRPAAAAQTRRGRRPRRRTRRARRAGPSRSKFGSQTPPRWSCCGAWRSRCWNRWRPSGSW